MRIVKTQTRVIQVAVVLTVLIMAFGLLTDWRSVEPREQSIPAAGVPGNSQTPVDPSPPAQEPSNTTPAPAGTADKLTNSKVVCLGDSFTSGFPGQMKDSWPAQVQTLLKIEVINAGKTQQNTEDLLTRFDQEVLTKQPGRVILFGGVGDALRGRTLEDFQKNMKALVEKAEANHIQPILVYTIPYPGTEKLYQQYRDWQVAYAKEKKLTVLDFKTVLYDEKNVILKKYSDDGKYPNKVGYKAMGEYAAGVLK